METTVLTMTDEPKVYVGTYRKYNEGSIKGKWITLTDYSSFEEFEAACRAVHGDESDAELMFQDYEDFPDFLYNEGGMSEEAFNIIVKIYEEEKGEAFEAFLFCYGKPDSLDGLWDEFEEAYQGEFDSERKFAEQLADDLIEGIDGDSLLAQYFDYDYFARDLFMSDYYYHNGHVFRR
jgi:antirestriction protein